MNIEEAKNVIKDILEEMEDSRDKIAVEALSVAIQYIEERQQRPHGEWISLDDNLCGLQRFKCSNCGHQIFCEHSKICQYKGCYCGAKMDNLQSGGGE